MAEGMLAEERLKRNQFLFGKLRFEKISIASVFGSGWLLREKH
jgi:hypothetical protein